MDGKENQKLKYSTIGQLIDKKKELSQRIQYLESILQSENEEKIEQTIDHIKMELENLKKVQNKMKSKGYDPDKIKNLLDFLKKYVYYMNLFLNSIDLVVKVVLNNDLNENIQIKFQYIMASKHKEINVLNDVTRNVKAQIELAIIYSIQFAFNKDILINTSVLPETIATKKTFTKALQNIEETINTDRTLNECTRIILDIKNIVENDPTIIIE